jgi:hypothetical protein
VRLHEEQIDRGFVPEHVYSPNRIWLLEAKDVTPIVNVVLSMITALLLVAAFAFWKGMMP